jgi:hypothetical protein
MELAKTCARTAAASGVRATFHQGPWTIGIFTCCGYGSGPATVSAAISVSGRVYPENAFVGRVQSSAGSFLDERHWAAADQRFMTLDPRSGPHGFIVCFLRHEGGWDATCDSAPWPAWRSGSGGDAGGAVPTRASRLVSSECMPLP